MSTSEKYFLVIIILLAVFAPQAVELSTTGTIIYFVIVAIYGVLFIATKRGE